MTSVCISLSRRSGHQALSAAVSAVLFVAAFLAPASLVAGAGPFSFVPGSVYDSTITSPDAALGYPLGSRPARYDEAVRYLQLLDRQSPRVTMHAMGKTHEQRDQYYLVISSEANHQRLGEIRRGIAGLAAPGTSGGTSAGAGNLEGLPAVVWLGYGIHGDELSSVDAALQIAYQLAAGTDSATRRIVESLVVCIDPMENPDGRERFLSQMQQWTGAVPSADLQSIQHTGVWPYGRGNHYLFDLNRDWFMLEHPETEARIRTIVQWTPQVLIDSHEMGGYDTYLFSPPREPINPNIGQHSTRWWKIFAADQARAFDRYGWSYYTREWNDEWYPGYGSSWALYVDAVGILYEQAGTDGSLIKRPDGTTLTYHEAVHHHIVSSMANLSTAARHRKELLEGYAAGRRESVASPRDGVRVFYLVPGKNQARAARLVEKLLAQGIRVAAAQNEFAAEDVHDPQGTTADRRLPAGTYMVALDQPQGRLARAILEFDPRMTSSFLQEERKELEKKKDTKLYDVTSWSLPLAYGVEAYWSAVRPSGSWKAVDSIPRAGASVDNPGATYGYLVDNADDRGVEALARLLDKGYVVRAARESVVVDGRTYGRGSVLLRVKDNPPDLAGAIQEIAQATGAPVHGVNTALSSAGPDLGGNDFVLLQMPRTALVGGPGISIGSFSTLWYALDYRLKLRTTILDAQQLAGADLQKYNVIILPSASSASQYARVLGKDGVDRLKGWVSAGGTLIGISNAAAFLADTTTGMSLVRLRQQALKDLDLFTRALEWESQAGQPVVDSLRLWRGVLNVQDTARAAKAASNEKELMALDERMRLFMPRGAMLRVNLDQEHWLSYGAGASLPATMFTPNTFLARDPVETSGRFAQAPQLRVAGLLWPEARERFAGTAYATREARGRGQVILFTDEPNFRGYFHGTERLLFNAVLLGPGFGAAHPVQW